MPSNDELTAAIRAIQDRVRAMHPQGSLGDTGVIAPDLMPLVHARDAAEAKVAAIGTVNPRRGGIVNAILQSTKKLVARALDWHVREQVEFNRAVVQCVQAALDAMSEQNRALSQTVSYAQLGVSSVRSELDVLVSRLRSDLDVVDSSIRGQLDRLEQIVGTELAQAKDIRTHWAQWREGWEEKLNRGEVYMLRTISELNSAFQHRSTLTEESFRRSMLEHNANFQTMLAKTTLDIQQKLWSDLQKSRGDFEKLIFDELRVLRQRGVAQPAAAVVAMPATAPEQPIELDWLHFANRFRGSEERVRGGVARYVELLRGTAGEILDIGCGRGEFLEAAREAGIGARGIDLSEESVAVCRGKGLDAEVADLFTYLAALPAKSLGGVFCSQVIEHLPAAALPRTIHMIGEKLRPGALAIFETPNPECLAIYATHFYIDPTHTRPVPAPLLVFYLEEAGCGEASIDYLNPAVETMPSLKDLPEAFQTSFFGGLDYAVIARKL